MNDLFLATLNYSDKSDLKMKLGALTEKYRVVHLRGVPKGVDYISFYTDIVDSIGKVVNVGEDSETGNLTNERWTDVRYVKEMDGTFRHSNTRQPLHTDAAYTEFRFDINFFFCIENAEVGGATTFIDGVYLLSLLKKFEPALLEELTNTDVLFQKGNGSVKVKKIIDLSGEKYELNWNSFRIADENTGDVKDLCKKFQDFLEMKIVSGGLLTPIYLQPGECLFFHDDKVLHGRNSFYGDRYLIKGAFDLK
jgi:alpha-ketoglutarate-dependent taurine dioxygenase